MRNIFKVLLLSAVIAPAVVSCDEDTQLPAYVPVKVGQAFTKGDDNSIVAINGWTNYNEVGSRKWTIQKYRNTSYAEFNPYSSGDASNIGWLITPSLDLTDGKDYTLTFLSSQSYVSSSANKLEVLISKDYDGTNVTAATWTPLSATLPTTSSKYFEFIESGDVDLAAYTGSKVHIAFKVTGSGTNADLDGSYQIDKVIVQ